MGKAIAGAGCLASLSSHLLPLYFLVPTLCYPISPWPSLLCFAAGSILVLAPAWDTEHIWLQPSQAVAAVATPAQAWGQSWSYSSLSATVQSPLCFPPGSCIVWSSPHSLLCLPWWHHTISAVLFSLHQVVFPRCLGPQLEQLPAPDHTEIQDEVAFSPVLNWRGGDFACDLGKHSSIKQDQSCTDQHKLLNAVFCLSLTFKFSNLLSVLSASDEWPGAYESLCCSEWVTPRSHPALPSACIQTNAVAYFCQQMRNYFTFLELGNTFFFYQVNLFIAIGVKFSFYECYSWLLIWGW